MTAGTFFQLNHIMSLILHSFLY